MYMKKFFIIFAFIFLVFPNISKAEVLLGQLSGDSLLGYQDQFLHYFDKDEDFQQHVKGVESISMKIKHGDPKFTPWFYSSWFSRPKFYLFPYGSTSRNDLIIKSASNCIEIPSYYSSGEVVKWEVDFSEIPDGYYLHAIAMVGFPESGCSVGGESYNNLVFVYGDHQDLLPLNGTRHLNYSGITEDGYLLIEGNKTDDNNKLDPVIIIPGIMGSWKIGNKWYLDPIRHTYDNLWEALIQAGYEGGKSLFALPYEWRDSNVITAKLLKNRIEEIKNICNCDKVDIVAHSMGGLVARQYAQGDDYNDDIDQLIFLATPHRGSPKSYLTWEAGEFGFDPKNKINEKLFELEVGFYHYDDIFQYVRWRPVESVRDLLPVYDYLQYKDLTQLKPYPFDYPRNTFLEKLNTQSSLEKLKDIDIVNIIADAGESSTINNFRVVDKNFPNGIWEHGYPNNYDVPFVDKGLFYGPGDETVPEVSNINFLGLNDIVINSTHNDIVTDAQKQVIQELTGYLPDEKISLSDIKDFLMVRVFSPADFVIIAPDGKKLGKDFLNFITINEIKGAFYSGFDSDIEFAVIPDPIDGEYKIELNGTGAGKYTLSISYIDDNNNIDKNFIGLIQSEQSQRFNFVYNSNEEEIINCIVKEVNVKDVIQDIEMIYNKKWLIKKSDKKILIKRLNTLDKKLNHVEEQIKTIESLNQKYKNNKKIVDKIDKIFIKKQKIVNKELNLIKNKLVKIEKKEKINKEGYNLLINDINYLKINL
jgi:pimeloyl-ACP methyl ester carboxylesterase